jgi:hypothetical protein
MKGRLPYLDSSAAVPALLFPAFLSTSVAYAVTTTISQDTSFSATTIAAGDTFVIGQGATLAMSVVTSKGTLINHGKIAALFKLQKKRTDKFSKRK